jgi:hypothetical protein
MVLVQQYIESQLPMTAIIIDRKMSLHCAKNLMIQMQRGTFICPMELESPFVLPQLPLPEFSSQLG